MFDWENYLDSLGIEYFTEGKNVTAGCLSFRCPFCGDDDPSNHGNLDPTTGHFACWRDTRNHSTRNPIWLIRTLSNCSMEEAKEIFGNDYLDENSLENIPWFEQKRLETPVKYPWPQSFRQIENKGVSKLHFQYLMNRGYSEDQVNDLVLDYDLRMSLDFRWSNRIMIPVWDEEFHQVYGWTARHIGNHELRYVSYPEGNGIKKQLFNYCYAKEKSNVLVICEGPFDVLRVDSLGFDKGIKAVGLFTTSATESQMSQLYKLKDLYEHFVIMLDQNAENQAMNLSMQMSLLNPKIATLPDSVKDPAELSIGQLVEIIERTI